VWLIVVTFDTSSILQTDALNGFSCASFFSGFGGANYTVYFFLAAGAVRNECRASALAFAQNVGRFCRRRRYFLVGIGVRHFQTLGIPVALTAVAFVVGLLLLPFGVETRASLWPAVIESTED